MPTALSEYPRTRKKRIGTRASAEIKASEMKSTIAARVLLAARFREAAPTSATRPRRALRAQAREAMILPARASNDRGDAMSRSTDHDEDEGEYIDAEEY